MPLYLDDYSGIENDQPISKMGQVLQHNSTENSHLIFHFVQLDTRAIIFLLL